MRLGSEGTWRLVQKLLAGGPALTSSKLAREAGVSRQAAHRHLASLTKEGRLVREGRGRGCRYRAAVSPSLRLDYAREGLSEDAVWGDARARASWLGTLSENVQKIVHYALTELVNNAIEHSSGARVEVLFAPPGTLLAFEVIDDGVGAFEKIRGHFGLPDALAAVQELSKGKATTAPDRHTGEGIFFVSKIADLFEIESGTLVWKVDNLREDTALGNVAGRAGTRVRFEVSATKARTLAELFAEYTVDYAFAKSRIVVKLFEIGTRFVSRSEARRLLHNLERFSEVVLDFRGVTDLGQGFADEVFRVWPASHSGTTLVTTRMAPAVEFMVRRAQAGGRLP